MFRSANQYEPSEVRAGMLYRTIATSEYRQPSVDTTFEAHYTIGDLSKQWRIGRETVRLLVKDEPGVVKIRMGRHKP